MRIVRISMHSVAAPQIIRVAQLGTQRLEDRPVPLAEPGGQFALQVIAEVVLYSVIVDSRVLSTSNKNTVPW